jgi:hypothetical protein
MIRAVIFILAVFGSGPIAVAAEDGVADKGDKSNFDRTHEALQKAERSGAVERPAPAERPTPADHGLINNSERGQMQRLENDPSNR